MMKAVRTVSLPAIACLFVTLASGNEGRFPIFQPTVITQGGAYFVTNNFTASGQPALRIETSQYVIIDFGGHTVTGNVETSRLTSHDVMLKNGRLTGVIQKSPTDPAPPTPTDTVSLALTELIVSGSLTLDPAPRCRIRSAYITGAVSLGGSAGAIQVFITDSTFTSTVTISGMASSVVRNNSFSRDVTFSDAGGYGTQDSIISTNTVSGALVLADHGTVALHTAILFNTSRGLSVAGRANKISGNLVQAQPLTVSGSQNTIDGNTVQGSPGFSLVLTGNDNVYKNNNLHGALNGPVQNSGTGNIDGGGNVL